MNKLLIVEDTKLFATILKKEIETKLSIPLVVVGTMAEAALAISQHKGEFFLALLDLNLPDAPNGQVVDLVRGQNRPSIVFTGDFSDELREQMLGKEVIDYVLKENASSIDYVVQLVSRIRKNMTTKGLVVDDSKSSRVYMQGLLRNDLFNVLVASNGQEALTIMEQNRDIRLVITDCKHGPHGWVRADSQNPGPFSQRSGGDHRGFRLWQQPALHQVYQTRGQRLYQQTVSGGGVLLPDHPKY